MDKIIVIEAMVSYVRVAQRNIILCMPVVKHEEQSAASRILGAAQLDITVTEEYSIWS